MEHSFQNSSRALPKPLTSIAVIHLPLCRLLTHGIDDLDLASKYFNLYTDNPFFAKVCAGQRHHHWWEGGLEQHVCEIIGYMVDQLRFYPEAYPGVTASDCIIVAFLHDFDKVWAYTPITDEERKQEKSKYAEGQIFKASQPSLILDGVSRTLLELQEYGIRLTEKQLSAILFAHGGYSDANFSFGGSRTRTCDTVMRNNPLAVLMHAADMFSSQLLSAELKKE